MDATELEAAKSRLRRLRAGVEKSQDIYGVAVDDPPNRFTLAAAGRQVKRLMLGDERAVIAAALAPTDDATPIDAGWLVSQGWAAAGINGHSMLLVPRDLDAAVVEVFLEDDVVALVQAGFGNGPDDHIVLTSLPPIRTRGQLRRLVAALGGAG